MKSARAWLYAGAAVCAAALASPPSPPIVSSTSTSASMSASQDSASPTDEPDDEFIEFLGADDAGDVAWWDFLRGTAPRSQEPPAPPPSKVAKP